MIPFSISRSELRGLSALERFEVEEAITLSVMENFLVRLQIPFFPGLQRPFRVTILGSNIVWRGTRTC